MKLNLLLLCVLFGSTVFSQKMMRFADKPLPRPALLNNKVFIFNSGQANYLKLTKAEQEFYYWINYSRNNPEEFLDSAVLPIVGVYPQLKGENLISLESDLKHVSNLPMFRLNDSLIKMAKYHAHDIVVNNASPSHNSTNGDTFTERFKKFGLTKCGGENISYGGGDALFAVVLLYLDLNVPDLGHRKALLNPAYTNTGIGEDSYANGYSFIVEDFGCPQN